MKKKIKPLSFIDGIDIYSILFKNIYELEKHYEKFWLNVFYNDAYVFYKNAIDFYKNVQNSKFHSFFSGFINSKLYTGDCGLKLDSVKEGFMNEIIDNINPDDLCKLSIQVINILDKVLVLSPKLPYNQIVFRAENRDINNYIFNIKPGDFYRSLGFMSTTVNPMYIISKHVIGIDKDEKMNTLNIYFTILLPEKSKGYYMNYPFGIEYDNKNKLFFGNQEFEILLPRDNIYKIIETNKINDKFFIKMILVSEINPDFNILKTEDSSHIIPKIIYTQKEYKNLLTNNKYYELGIKYDQFIKNYEHKSILNLIDNLYKTFIYNCGLKYYESRLIGLIYDIKSKDLLYWESYPPVLDKKFYKKLMSDLKRKDEKLINWLYKGIVYLKNNMKDLLKGYIYIHLSSTDKIMKQIYENKDIIDIEYPIEFSKKLEIDTLYNNNFMLKSFNKKPTIKDLFITDEKYPISTILKLKLNKPIKYYQESCNGYFTYHIDKIKINKINKIFLSSPYYVLVIMCESL